MKNILTGWATTLIGLVIIILSVLHFYGFLYFPAPSDLSLEAQFKIGMVVGLILFLVPAGTIEQGLKKWLNKKSDQ